TDLAQYRELAAFAQFASDLDEATRKQLDRGARVTELLKQAQYSPQSIGLMASTLFAVNKGYMDSLEIKQVLPFEAGMHAFLKDKHAPMLATMEKNGAKWDVKPAKADDSDAKKAFKKECQDAEAQLAAAIADFKKTGTY
ncbi:MAG: F0F1 ATP synthase subunit alpha, partial [Hydrogenophaga sp.]